MKIALVIAESKSGEEGGAEKFFKGLHKAFNANGHNCTTIGIVSNESSIETIKESYEKFRQLDLNEYDLVISTKAPSYAINHPNHIVYLVHTMRVFYDMFEKEFKKPSNELLSFRKELIDTDKKELSKPGVRKIFTIGEEVTKRLKKYNDLESEVLYPPLEKEHFFGGIQDDYIFIPSRLHRWKRIDLIIEAMKYVKSNITLHIAGTGEDEEHLKKIANKKTVFLGRISDEEIIQEYSKCLAVPFVPVNEDYGYVTLEAFKSKKPVITCIDSGEPKNFVLDNINGFVCKPNAKDLAKKIDFLSENREQAKKMGERGFDSVKDITWKNVVEKLIEPMKEFDENIILVLDMQPIDPAVGGGRLRLLGLYHNLGANLSTLYIGSYDWQGEKYRDHYITEHLREIDIPLSSEHFAENDKLTALYGQNVIDLMFHKTAYLSREYVNEVIYHIKRNKTVVFSHPWVYPIVKKFLTKDHLVIYDSQNVESYLRYVLLNNKSSCSDVIKEVAKIEYELCCEADVILCCSDEDKQMFNSIYDIGFEKMELVPNGVLTNYITPKNDIKKNNKYFNNDNKTAIFMGSSYGPNVNAAVYINDVLAVKLPDINFIIAGSVGNSIIDYHRDNVLITGFIDDEKKIELLQVSSFAINPVESGSGTNIKMFDFMAAGLPIITTEIGARGILSYGKKAFFITKLEEFGKSVSELSKNNELLHAMSIDSRKLAEDQYSFENISYKLGFLLESCVQTFGQEIKVSIVIPSYERKKLLLSLLSKLNKQNFNNFEVIVIDQSAQSIKNELEDYSFALKYIQSRIKGAVKARNFGAMLARGDIIGFIDDDCYPVSADWIGNAYKVIANNINIAGIEGKISSDFMNDPNYRTVSNVGFEGIGFMTANLFIRKSIFNKINGFDESFENPHFREDTDFGWRASNEGEMPYVHEVEVFHPAHKKDIARESDEERDKFFIKDPLLMAKHPVKYEKLFLLEKHYERRPAFWKYFTKGLKEFDIDIKKYTIYKFLPQEFKDHL